MAKAPDPIRWSIPRIWPGRTVYILGGGPSLASVDVDRLRGERVIACNNAYKLGRWIDVALFADKEWLGPQVDGLRNFPGLKISLNENHDSKLGRALNIRVVKMDPRIGGLVRNPAVVAWNFSTGAAAINVAMHFGAKRIVLLGFDMRKINGRQNWHDEHGNEETHNPYQTKFLPRFPKIAESLAKAGIECINATPGSALTCFPIVEPDEVLAGLGRREAVAA